MSQKPCLKAIASGYDRSNLARAREVMADPEKYPPYLQDWAKRVLERLSQATYRS